MDEPGILLIEGEDGLTERVLRKYRIDNRVELVRDGEAALARLRAGFAKKAQLLILDHAAPGIPALEIVMRARALSGLDGLPVIVACTSTMRAPAAPSVLGATEYVTSASFVVSAGVLTPANDCESGHTSPV